MNPQNLIPHILFNVGRSVAMTFERGIAEDEADSPYAGFSVCHYTSDSPERVSEARRKFAERLGIDAERLVIPRQTHSTEVRVIDSLPAGAEQLEGVDALVTRMPGVALCISTADCVPVVAADGQGVIAVAHAGWRGMAGGIVEKTIEAMVGLGSRREEIVVACGPHISVEAFEVGEEVAERFEEDGAVVRIEGAARPHVSLYEAMRRRAMRAGVREYNILPLDRKFCSFSTPGVYFSARRLGIASGRTPTVVFTREANKGQE